MDSKKLFTAFLLTISALTAGAAQSGKKSEMRLLANPGDFAVLSDVQSSKQMIFLSYVGKQFDHCGIKLSLSKSPGQTALTNDLIMIKNLNTSRPSDIGVIENGVLLTHESPDASLYGVMYSIETRSGKTLSEAFKSLNPSEKVDAIVEILSCQ